MCCLALALLLAAQAAQDGSLSSEALLVEPPSQIDAASQSTPKVEVEQRAEPTEPAGTKLKALPPGFPVLTFHPITRAQVLSAWNRASEFAKKARNARLARDADASGLPLPAPLITITPAATRLCVQDPRSPAPQPQPQPDGVEAAAEAAAADEELLQSLHSRAPTSPPWGSREWVLAEVTRLQQRREMSAWGSDRQPATPEEAARIAKQHAVNAAAREAALARKRESSRRLPAATRPVRQARRPQGVAAAASAAVQRVGGSTAAAVIGHMLHLASDISYETASAAAACFDGAAAHVRALLALGVACGVFAAAAALEACIRLLWSRCRRACAVARKQLARHASALPASTSEGSAARAFLHLRTPSYTFLQH